MANYKKLTENYTKNAELALQKFIRIDSHYDASTVKEGAPYGDGVKKTLDYLAKLAEDYGYSVDKCDGYATEITIGEEGPIIGVYGHSDVVPVSGKWTNPPFSGTVKDGKMWGRGAIDDKGPLMAAFYGAKLLKDNGLVKGYRIRIVSGGDEERGSSCLKYYFGKLKKEHCALGFTPDADFPLIYAEKGMIGGMASKKLDLGPVIAMNGGVVSNAVCDRLVVTIKSDKKFAEHLKKKSIEAEVTPMEGFDIVAFKGKASHGSRPENGINAALIAFKALGEFYGIEELKKLASLLADPNGKNFGGYGVSKVLGATTYNYGLVKYDGTTLTVSVDFRFGEETDGQKMIEAFKEATGFEFATVSTHDYLYYDPKSPLVSTLMKVYKKETMKLFAKPLAIGGGTYAKEAKNIVAFGACFDGNECNMHSSDEYIDLSDFHRDIAIYAHAIHALGELAAKGK